ncbi:arginase family protein [Pseudonocardia sp. RS11V-5]|uniref:arginase family protein n=1 Tax=Pseudonocardia terrae TaxID=2905831 RepID=UPI001E38D290|nr:arginase family protein [Pseudonocardia terrae]MCE3556398.1 arginase family protein [Pseudonocardia terrae]
MPASSAHSTAGDGDTLRLLCPQWQGAGTSSVRELASEFPFDVARRGYAVVSAVLDAVLPPHVGPTATAPVTMGDEGLDTADGIEAKAVVVDQLVRALEVIGRHAPARIVTLGGECAVSVAPFSSLARRYCDDLAILWIDSHPDIGTPASRYPGFHAMAVAALTGHAGPDVLALLPATVDPARVALVGLHAWTEDDFPNVAEWGIRTFAPDELRASTEPLLRWLAGTGCTHVAIHFDVDTVDSNEIVLGLGAVPDGLTSGEVRRLVADVTAASDVVGLTIAEFFPRQVVHLQQVLAGFPLLSPSSAPDAP